MESNSTEWNIIKRNGTDSNDMERNGMADGIDHLLMLRYQKLLCCSKLSPSSHWPEHHAWWARWFVVLRTWRDGSTPSRPGPWSWPACFLNDALPKTGVPAGDVPVYDKIKKIEKIEQVDVGNFNQYRYSSRKHRNSFTQFLPETKFSSTVRITSYSTILSTINVQLC